MIKFIANHANGRPILGLGLSRRNCELLLEGRPIFIDLKVMLATDPLHDMNEATVLLFAGEDEESLVKELRSAGLTWNNVRPHYDDEAQV